MRSVLPQDANTAREELRLQKVERLRAAIADGTYSVSASALAEKMMERMSSKDAPSTEKDELPTEKDEA